MRQPVIAGNWKMNGTIAETEELISSLLTFDLSSSAARIVVCPPFTALSLSSKLLQDSVIAVGGQDMSVHDKGAFTAEVSAAMLLTSGATYVILGHSERRQYHAESDQLVNRKARLAFSSGLTPIICVGESLAERESDKTEEVIGDQITGVTAGFSADELSRSIVAYEPVWAIGTGRTATPEMAQEVHRFIRGKLSADIDRQAAESLPILYGGSVKPSNASELLAQPDIDGALVGGASLKAEEFVSIIKSA